MPDRIRSYVCYQVKPRQASQSSSGTYSRFRLLSWTFLLYLALDITAHCICEIHGLALDGFDLNTVQKLSSKEKKFDGAGI